MKKKINPKVINMIDRCAVKIGSVVCTEKNV